MLEVVENKGAAKGSDRAPSGLHGDGGSGFYFAQRTERTLGNAENGARDREIEGYEPCRDGN